MSSGFAVLAATPGTLRGFLWDGKAWVARAVLFIRAFYLNAEVQQLGSHSTPIVPGEEFANDAAAGASGVMIAHPRGGEFQEAGGGALTSGCYGIG